MRRRLAILLIALLAVLLLPLTALAADTHDDGFVFKVDGSVRIDANEKVDSVILLNGNAIVDGVVENTLWVLNGNATVNGQVHGDVMVANGTLHLTPHAVVKNVTVVRGDLNRAPGATITGEIHERSAFVSFGWGRTIFSFAFWFGTTIPLIGLGLLFAAVAGKQIADAGTMLKEQPGNSVAAAVLVWIGIPVLAVLAILTLIGIPIGVLAFLALPLLWVAGYVVAAARLGLGVVRRLKLDYQPEHPYLATTTGIVAFQVIGIVPFIGGLIVGIAGLVGAGALAALAYQARKRTSEQRKVLIRQEPLPAA